MKTFRLLYHAALSLLPIAFQTRHGAEAARMAASRVREESGMRRVIRAVAELADLLFAIPRIRRDYAARRPHVDQTSQRQEHKMRDGFLSDLRYASRSLLHAKGFLSVALTTLAAGIALCAAVIVLVNAYLVRGLPYPESERLFWIRYGDAAAPPIRGLDRLEWRTLDDVLEHPIAWDLDGFNLRGSPYPEVARGTWVTSGFMDGFGVRPVLGRGFIPADFTGAAPPVALISHRLWQARFGGDAAIVGRQFEAYVSDRPQEPQTFTIVGVLPEGLWHLNVFTEIMAPLRGPSYPYMARLRRGVTPEGAAERITTFVRTGGGVREDWRVELRSAHAVYVEQIRPLLTALAAATALVMLIACVNVAVLFTVRATQRRREIAVRKALGAGTARIGRTLVGEAIVVGTAATVLGTVLAHAVVTATAPLMERHLGRSAPGGAGTLALDGRTLLGVLLIGLFATVVCCIVQFWASSGAPVSLALSGGQKGGSAGPQQRRAHGFLIAVEVAACLSLLVGAALMLQTSLRILNVDMGLDARNVLVGQISVNQRRYPDNASQTDFYERLRAGISALESVRALAFTSAWPLQATPPREVGRAEPQAPLAPAGLAAVSREYFDTVDIALADGRQFSATDARGAEPVAIVSRTLAARLWPNQRAVGERLQVAPPPNAPRDRQTGSFLVVGVVEDVRHTHTDDALADVYVSLLQFPSAATFMYVRTTGQTARLEQDLRAVLARLDPDLALGAPRPLAEILDQQRAGTRFLASLLAMFAVCAAVLALLGIYGVIAYTVHQREREIAVRLAVGADRAAIMRLFLRQGGSLLIAGLATGVVGALLLGRLLQSQLFGVRATEPVVLAAVTAAFALCGLVAIAWPARVAASTDPAKALRD